MRRSGLPPSDPAANYPALLNRIALQPSMAIFGETLAVMAVEHWGAHGATDWVVPALPLDCYIPQHDGNGEPSNAKLGA